MKYCYYCGTGLDDGMNFCPRCGKKFNDGSDNPEAFKSFTDERILSEINDSVGVESDINQNVYDNMPCEDNISTEFVQRESAESMNTTISKKKFNPWWIGIVAVVAIVIVFCLGKFGIININGVTVDIPELAQSVLYLEIYDDGDVIGSASGFLIADDTLVTNYHVIDGAHNIIAYTDDGEGFAEFNTVLAFDIDLDLAILSGKDDELEVNYFILADSSLVKQGDKVYVVGYPLGLANTLSEGIVGAVYNSDEMTLIQTSAPISQGNSGGPVLNKNGEVIGVTSMYLDDGQNMNYSVSSNDVKYLFNNCFDELILLTDLFPGDPIIDTNDESNNTHANDNSIYEIKENNITDFYGVWISSYGSDAKVIFNISRDSSTYYYVQNGEIYFRETGTSSFTPSKQESHAGVLTICDRNFTVSNFSGNSFNTITELNEHGFFQKSDASIIDKYSSSNALTPFEIIQGSWSAERIGAYGLYTDTFTFKSDKTYVEDVISDAVIIHREGYYYVSDTIIYTTSTGTYTYKGEQPVTYENEKAELYYHDLTNNTFMVLNDTYYKLN